MLSIIVFTSSGLLIFSFFGTLTGVKHIVYSTSYMPAAARLNILGSQLTSELVEYSSGGIEKNPRVPQR